MNDDLVVLGKMSADERAQKLMELGELRDLAGIADDETLQSGFELKNLFAQGPRAWEHPAHAFGFLSEEEGASDLASLEDAAALPADGSLRGARVDIHLERLRVSDYPGRGMHRILFDIQARSEREGGADDVRFNVLARVREGGTASQIGAPVFLGLGVGEGGAGLRCVTVNVKNEEDEALFAALESEEMRRGLVLLPGEQPAVAVVSAMASALSRALARHHRNAALQDIALGLDFGGVPGAARLRLGTYFAVQVPEEMRSACWRDWAYHRQSGLLVNRDAPTKPIPYNYVAFGVRRHGA